MPRNICGIQGSMILKTIFLLQPNQNVCRSKFQRWLGDMQKG